MQRINTACDLNTSNLQLLQSRLNALGYPVGRLKHRVPRPPYVVIRARRHRIRKFVGLEHSEWQRIIACGLLSSAETRENMSTDRTEVRPDKLTAIRFAFMPLGSSSRESKYFHEHKIQV